MKPRISPLFFALAVAAALGLSACQQEPTETEEEAVVVLPPDPGSAGKATLAGIDSDGDGVRDDAQIHIHHTYSDPATRAAARQLAEAFQGLMVTGSAQTPALAAAVSLNAAIDCLYGLRPADFGSIVDDVEGVMVDTETRLRAYVKAGSFLSAGSFSVSTVADNRASCREAP